MKKGPVLLLALLFVSTLGTQPISAQIPVKIPRIPGLSNTDKSKRERPESERPKREQPPVTEAEPATEPPEEKSSSQPTAATQDKWANDSWVMVHVEDIGKVQEDVESYIPGKRDYFVRTTTYPYLLFAVSAREREDWLKRSNALDIRQSPNNKIDPALDALAAAVAKKLPTYIPDMKVYRFGTVAEQRLMKEELKTINGLKIYAVGIKHANWLIDKNDYGVPTSRYKWGLIWARESAADHPFCRIYYVNIVQDYSGGGTYEASYAKHVDDEVAGCPSARD